MLNHTSSSPTLRTALHEMARTSRRHRRDPIRLSTLASVAVLVWTIGGGSPAHSTPQENTYATLDDSYISGVRAPPYNDDGRKWTAGTYARQVTSQTGKSLGSGACAEAHTKGFYQPGKEATRLDHLNASASLVTFLIGGSGTGFSILFSKCVTAAPLTTYSNSKEVSEQVDDAISALAGKTTRTGITSYDMLVADIAVRVPGTTVVAVGYPHMFTLQGAGQILPVPGRCEGVTKVGQRWTNARANEIDAATKVAAQCHGYRSVGPPGPFIGHGLCGKQSFWLDGLINDKHFHPNAADHRAIADSIMGILQEQPAATQKLSAVTQAQVDSTRPTGSFTLARNDGRLTLDVSVSTDSDGMIVNVGQYIRRANDSKEILTGTRATVTMSTGERVSVTVVVTDSQGKEGFTIQITPAA